MSMSFLNKYFLWGFFKYLSFKFLLIFLLKIMWLNINFISNLNIIFYKQNSYNKNQILIITSISIKIYFIKKYTKYW